MSDPSQVSSAWHVREALNEHFAIGQEFTAADVQRSIIPAADVSVDAVSSALSDIYNRDSCLFLVRKEGRMQVYRKLKEPRAVGKRLRRLSARKPLPPKQADMPLPAVRHVEPPVATDEAVAVIRAKLTEIGGMVADLASRPAPKPDIKVFSDAEIFAETALRQAALLQK